MEAYYPFKGEAGASIAVELFHGKQSVPKHFHEFNEFVLVLKGTCKHRFGSQESILIPGDIFLVPAHKSHEYIIESSLTIYNVQFYPRRLEKLWGGSWPSHLYQNEKMWTRSSWMISGLLCFHPNWGRRWRIPPTSFSSFGSIPVRGSIYPPSWDTCIGSSSSGLLTTKECCAPILKLC